jgi:hypothetical protein
MPSQRGVTEFVAPEPFVSADEAAKFLGINRRLLLSLARRGIAGSYAVGTGEFRKTWVFRLSELASAIDPKSRADVSRKAPQRQSGYDLTIRRSSLK